MIHNPFIIFFQLKFLLVSFLFLFPFFYFLIAVPLELHSLRSSRKTLTQQLWMKLLKEDDDSLVSRSWRMLESILTQLAPDCSDAVFHGAVHR